MSKENADKFIEEMLGSKKMQKKLKKQQPATMQDVILFAKKMKLDFTEDELNQALSELDAMELSDDLLEKISAGAIPTPVNGQITDSVT